MTKKTHVVGNLRLWQDSTGWCEGDLNEEVETYFVSIWKTEHHELIIEAHKLEELSPGRKFTKYSNEQPGV